MEPYALVALGVALAFALGGLVKGVVGFGLPVVTLPLLILLVDVRVALVLMTVPILITNLYQALRGGFVRDIFRDFWWLFAAMSAGFALGGLLILNLDPGLLVGLVGVAVTVFAAVSLYQPALHLPEKRQRPVGVLTGVVAGTLGGLTTLYGPPIIMYLLATGLPQKTLIPLLGAIYLLGGILLIGTYTSVSLLTWQLLAVSATCVLPALLGMGAGQWLRERVPPSAARKLTLVFLLLIGLSMLRNFL